MDTATDNRIRSQLSKVGLRWVDAISWNSSAATLYGQAIVRGEGVVAAGGALVVSTGGHTGRSPDDKFIVRDALTEETVWWPNNKSISRTQFETLKRDFMAHARLRRLFVQDPPGWSGLLVQSSDPCRVRICVARSVCPPPPHYSICRRRISSQVDGDRFAEFQGGSSLDMGREAKLSLPLIFPMVLY